MKDYAVTVCLEDEQIDTLEELAAVRKRLDEGASMEDILNSVLAAYRVVDAIDHEIMQELVIARDRLEWKKEANYGESAQ